MLIKLIVTSGVLALAPLAAAAFSPHLDGTMMPYDGFSRQAVTTPWDSTWTPVGSVYIARHGARFLSSQKKTTAVSKTLTEAQDFGTLSPRGEAFLSLLDSLDAATNGHWGALSPLGISEEQHLGTELHDLLNPLLLNTGVYAKASHIPRVVMSMYETCHSLNTLSPDLEISTIEGPSTNSLLRFFDTDSLYVSYLLNGDWKPVYEQFADKKIPSGPARRMLPREKDKTKLRNLTMDVYGILQGLRASGLDTDPSEWFSEPEYRACWETDNLRHYLQRSANPCSAIALQAVQPLLDTVVKDIDGMFDSKPGTVPTKLYFGHAETIIPLFAAMKLPACYAPNCTPEEVASQWKDWEVSPLGANLLAVCLENGRGERSLALRLNGEWIEIEGNAIIPWRFLKAIWSGTNPLQGGITPPM